jgi:single-stranded-DNA-specific exonuclease
LLEVSALQAHQLATEGIGFGIGPRLNAAGRLDDMRIGVQCLLSDDVEQARSLARQLNALNEKRREIERKMQHTADTQLATLDPEEADSLVGFGICLLDRSWHEGVIGILAGRLKEKRHLPVVIFTKDDDTHIKGSARSIPGVHIRDVLQSIAIAHPGMIRKFGGHAMAAGLTMRSDGFDTFRHAFDAAIGQLLKGRRRHREYLTDGSLDAAQRTLPNAQLLSCCQPWGQGFESPLFDDVFVVRNYRLLQGKHLKLTLDDLHDSPTLSSVQSPSPPSPVDAIAFNCNTVPVQGDQLRIVYSLAVNHWRGSDTLQLRVHYLEPARMR